MLDIGLINRSLEVTETPGLDTLDPRFQEIASLMQNEEIHQAAEQIEGLFQEEIFDIRVIGYYMYAVFQEQGVKALEQVFLCLTNILTENWEAVGPTKKKEKHTKVSCKWMLGRMAKMLDYHQEKGDSDWENWLSQCNSEEAGIIVDNLEQFHKALGRVVEDGETLELAAKIGRWLKDYHRIIYDAEPKEEEKEAEEQEQEQEQQEQGRSGATTARGETTSLEMIEGSYPMHMLVKKIKAFGALAEKQEFEKAAVIADAINNIIENFDPRVYFPQIFAEYYNALTPNIQSIAEYWEDRESVMWQAMAQLSEVDLETFVDGYGNE